MEKYRDGCIVDFLSIQIMRMRSLLTLPFANVHCLGNLNRSGVDMLLKVTLQG